MGAEAVPRTDRLKDFLSQCEKMDFGPVVLSESERVFYRRLNGQVLSLCRSLPRSVQTDSLLFLMEYSGLVPGGALDFFASYYPPIWSSLYWLSRHFTSVESRSARRAVFEALTAQSMAMLVHSLDDHLQDGQIPSSSLTILLRGRAWALMSTAFKRLGGGVPGGDRIVHDYIGDYNCSVPGDPRIASLAEYCHRFERQMGIGLIAPVLMATKMTGSTAFVRAVEKALRCFGIAWRLLDDIKDVLTDLECGTHTSIYLSLPEEIRSCWDGMKTDLGRVRKRKERIILTHILERDLIHRLKRRICTELELGASVAEAYGITGLAAEFRSLSTPLRSEITVHEESLRQSEPCLAPQ